MKRVTAILFLLIFFSATSNAKQVNELWKCTDKFESDKVLVKAKVLQERQFGEIDVAGITHLTQYTVQGFKRRWDFDARDDGRFKYALIIEPNGDGLYYEFPEVSASVSPDITLRCLKQ